jgi:uncharacterized membrane protein (UPF0182 family)
MEETLDQSLERIFSGTRREDASQLTARPEAAKDEKNLVARALEHYARSQRFLRQGDLAGFGQELNQVEALLKQMEKTR